MDTLRPILCRSQSLPRTSFCCESLQPSVLQRPLRPSCRPPIAGLLQAHSSFRRYAAFIACICQAQLCTGLRGVGQNMVRQVGEGCRALIAQHLVGGAGARAQGALAAFCSAVSGSVQRPVHCRAWLVLYVEHITTLFYCHRMAFKCRTGACGRSVNSFAQLILMQLGRL